MSQLSDYEINQIKKYIESFNTTGNKLIKVLEKNYFKQKFRDAELKLNDYSNEENKALKEAKRVIDKVMNSSGGFLSKEGLNKILDKKINDISKEINNLIDGYNKDISLIINNLPKLDSVKISLFSALEYEGDKKYIDIDFNINLVNDENILFETISENTNSILNTDNNFELINNIENNDFIFNEYTTDTSTTILGIHAISNPNIEKIRLSSVKEIYANAFSKPNNLKLIIISNSIEKININAFRNIDPECIIAFEFDKNKVMSLFKENIAIKERKIIYNYKDGDENLNIFEKYELPKTEKNKKTIIRSNTPLDNQEIKELFIKRNNKYILNINELEEGIRLAGTNVDKEKILYYSSLVRRIRALEEGSYWDYAIVIGNALSLSKKMGYIDESLAMIFALLYLNSSGYRMITSKDNLIMDEPSRIFYHPKMELKDLIELINNHNLSEDYLVNIYKNSLFVKELNETFIKPYYTIEESIKLMLMAIKTPDNYFYPTKSGIKKLN